MLNRVYPQALYCCAESGWGGVDFPHSSPYRAVLCTSSQSSAAVPAVLWQALSSAGRAPRPALQTPTAHRLVVGKSWGGNLTRTAELNLPKGDSKPNVVTWSSKSWGRERSWGELLLWKHWSSQEIIIHIEALFLKTWLNITHWWEVVNNCFLLLLLSSLCLIYLLSFN